MPPASPRLRASAAAALAALVGLAAALLVAAAPAASATPACSCGARTTAQQAAAAEVIFVGTVTEAPDPSHDPAGTGGATALLRVDRIYRGNPGPETDVATGSGDCALTGLRDGTTYVVFADEGGADPLLTDACRGTRRVATADVEGLEAAVGPGWPPAEAVSPDLGTAPAAESASTSPAAADADRDGRRWRPVLVGVAAVVAVALAGWRLLRSRRRARR